jgi:hypothetical protein
MRLQVEELFISSKAFTLDGMRRVGANTIPSAFDVCEMAENMSERKHFTFDTRRDHFVGVAVIVNVEEEGEQFLGHKTSSAPQVRQHDRPKREGENGIAE